MNSLAAKLAYTSTLNLAFSLVKLQRQTARQDSLCSWISSRSGLKNCKRAHARGSRVART